MKIERMAKLDPKDRTKRENNMKKIGSFAGDNQDTSMVKIQKLGR